MPYMLLLPEIWETTTNLTMEWASVVQLSASNLDRSGKTRRNVRCGAEFQEYLETSSRNTWKPNDPTQAMKSVFKKIVPLADRMLTESYSPLKLLHLNDYVMEKAFVYGVICLSRWLGEEHFPEGCHGQWPPELPEDMKPIRSASP